MSKAVHPHNKPAKSSRLAVRLGCGAAVAALLVLVAPQAAQASLLSLLANLLTNILGKTAHAPVPPQPPQTKPTPAPVPTKPNPEPQPPAADPPPSIRSLSGVKPLLPDTSGIIRDKGAARQLGKAFFWDVQVGSDGQACASCHFHAGADIRVKNQVNPGLNAVNADLIFSNRRNAPGKTGPNVTLTPDDFPFHQLADVTDRNSAVNYDSNDRFASQGTFAGIYTKLPALVGVSLASFLPATGTLGAWDKCTDVYEPTTNPFHSNGLIRRKVEPRQTPTMINAVFNVRQFWDGRANNIFNGVDPFGRRTNISVQSAGVLEWNSLGIPSLKKLELANSSLASQAVGPALSDFEMSCAGRTFPELGRKLLGRQALALQKVHARDSLLASLANTGGNGLRKSYRELIMQAFEPKYWAFIGTVTLDAAGAVKLDLAGYTQMEQNFSLFWGLAIQEYEATLISDQSPFDKGESHMSPEARAGMAVFTGKGKCVNCHNGPLFSAATRVANSDSPEPLVENMLMGDGRSALYDQGFYNIGVRPTSDDLGLGGHDPYGFDLSFSRQYKWKLLGQPGKVVDPNIEKVDPCKFAVPFDSQDCTLVPHPSSPQTSPRDAVDGSFKTPILRNVGLSPPYFHNGGQSSLAQLVQFYNRGGDRRGPLSNDTTGFGPTPFQQTNPTNLDPDIGDASRPKNDLGLTAKEQANLVEFLLSLSDPRVACHEGPFDHPELPIPNGHTEVARVGSKRAVDIVATLPATGADGLKQIGKPCLPNNGKLFGQLQDTWAQIVK